jgi:hypothetical protein
MLWNTLLLAMRTIRRNLMRSFLTILGIVIGIAAVVTLVTLGNGATRSVSDQIAAMGTNQLMVVPGQRFGPGSELGAPSFKMADVDAIRSQITAARGIAPVVSKAVTAGHRHEQRLLLGRKLGDGRWPEFQRHRGTRRQGGVCHWRDGAQQAVRPSEPGGQRDPSQGLRM